MSQTKRASKVKRPGKAISILGIAGASLAASGGGSVADIPEGDIPASPMAAPFHLFLGEEEISDVSLATFHLFSQEDLGALRGGIQLAVRGGCGCGRGCAGRGCAVRGCAGRGCAGRGCAVRGCGGRGCGWGGCGGCGWGWGCGGCCLSWGGCRVC